MFFLPQDPSKECEPYRLVGSTPIAPCGAIANSMFNGKQNGKFSAAMD